MNCFIHFLHSNRKTTPAELKRRWHQTHARLQINQCQVYVEADSVGDDVRAYECHIKAFSVLSKLQYETKTNWIKCKQHNMNLFRPWSRLSGVYVKTASTNQIFTSTLRSDELCGVQNVPHYSSLHAHYRFWVFAKPWVLLLDPPLHILTWSLFWCPVSFGLSLFGPTRNWQSKQTWERKFRRCRGGYGWNGGGNQSRNGRDTDKEEGMHGYRQGQNKES